MRGVGLERRGLWREYLRALEEASPQAFVMENVPELLRSAEYDAFREAATELGFNVDGRILLAADFGVPQTRRRAFVIGLLGQEPEWPQETHAAPGKERPGQKPWRTFRDAVEGLSPKPDGLLWHRGRNPRQMSLERYMAIPKER